MKDKILAVTVIVFVALTAWVWSAQAETKETKEAAEKITIGVPAPNGRSKAVKRWEATGEYLSAYIDHPVMIAPLDIKDMLSAVKMNRVDFFIVDPSTFVTAKLLYEAVPVDTMKTAGNDSFGGVIFTAATNKNINDLKDLKGKKFGAVEKMSLGGWQIAQKEFADAGIDAYRSFSTLRFFGNPSGVVKAVLNHKVHAGTVRTGDLEKLAENGEIQMKDIRILAEKHTPGFSLALSTALYPEWVLAKTASTDTALADKILKKLKYLTKGAKAVVDAQCTGWADPRDYSSMEELQKQLKVGVYKEEKKFGRR
jgi:phosphate/phosphite/phosphonate ABC transporter binding protein